MSRAVLNPAPRFALVITLCLASAAISLLAGPVLLSPYDVGSGLWSETNHSVIVREIRLPRTLLAAMIGAALGAVGAAFQAMFRNPLADPFVIGSSSGAALGVAVVGAFGGTALIGWSPVPAGAFVGALVATGLVYVIGTTGRNVAPTRLLLAGATVGSIFNAAVWLVLMRSNQPMQNIVMALLGSLAGRGWVDVQATLPWWIAGFLGVLALARPLDALAAGEETARGLGLPVRTAMAAIMAAGGLLAAAAVAAGGVIGFIGLVAPYLARPWFGHRQIVLIPASGLIGAILLLLADSAARVAVAPAELPVGVVTALLAGPFFLFVLRVRT